jgi:hypothetical protein
LSPRLCADNPNEIFTVFTEHINSLLHRTITDSLLVKIINKDRAFLEFRQQGEAVSVPLKGGYYLYLNQTLKARKENTKDGTAYCLQTLAYSYRIGEGPNRQDWLIRWEYNSRETEQGFHPRHHCHLQSKMPCFGDRQLLLAKIHVASGWVTIEEVIRFLIHELAVPPKADNWDEILQESEAKFRDWTDRSV